MKMNFYARKSLICIILVSLLIGCSKDSGIRWEIGGNQAKHKILVESEVLQNIKLCSDKYKNIGFPVHLNVHYDEKTYFGMLEGVCITVRAKKVKVTFATPSSGKVAIGTFEILDK